ncbi:MAG: alpha/beta fold hydrolase [Gemmatimonadaceae bacterium]
MYPAGLADPVARLVTLSTGERVRVVESGPPGGSPVFLLPGWACSVYLYRKNLTALGDAGYRAISADLRGHGLSDKPGDPMLYTTGAMVAHVVGIMDAIGIRRAMVAGLSMGGALALEVALRHPERVRGAALLNPTSVSGLPWMRVLHAVTPEWIVPALPFLVRRWMVAAMLRIVYGDRARPTDRDVEEYWAPTRLAGFARAMRHLVHHFSWGRADDRRLATLTVPLLLVVGTRDRLVDERDVARHTRAVRDARVTVVPGAGHAVNEEAPAETNAALSAFLRDLGPG